MPLSRENVDRIFDNAQERALSQPTQLVSWVQEGARAAQEVAKGNVDLIGTYWIILFGTLHDLRLHLEENHRGVSQMLPTVKDPDRIESSMARLAVLKTRLDAIARIRAVFNDDDCVYMQFMRHVHSHPLLANYAVSVRGSKLKATIQQHLLNRTMTVEETDAAIMRVLRRREELVFAGSAIEKVIASDFAKESLDAQSAFAAIWDTPDRVRTLAEIKASRRQRR
jgi:hypothetical protein